MVETEEQDCCKEGIMEKLKFGTEKSGGNVGELFKTWLQGTEKTVEAEAILLW